MFVGDDRYSMTSSRCLSWPSGSPTTTCFLLRGQHRRLPSSRIPVLPSGSRSRSRLWYSSSLRASCDDEWLQKLPEKKKPLYSHSLPCIEAWLRSLGFVQSKEDRASWSIERPDWHARLSLDVTDLFIRYLKNGPGNLDRDVERKFSYALSREDLENAILGGP